MPHRPRHSSTAQSITPPHLDPAPRQAATAADRPRKRQASPLDRRPAADPRPQLDHPPKAPRPEARPQSQPPTIPRKKPRSTRPEALFLHPSPAGSGTSRRHQPHKIARSASSAIPRRITSANSAPVTAPFLRLLCYSPSLSVKPVSTVLPSSR